MDNKLREAYDKLRELKPVNYNSQLAINEKEGRKTRLSEIAEFVIEKYPDCCMESNGVANKECREGWYEEALINELMDFFASRIIGMCCCGCPENTHNVIRKILNIRAEVSEKDIKYEEIQRRYKEEIHLDIENPLHHGALQSILYMLDEKGIVDHSGNINSCWLTKLGRMYLDVLNAWNDREERGNAD